MDIARQAGIILRSILMTGQSRFDDDMQGRQHMRSRAWPGGATPSTSGGRHAALAPVRDGLTVRPTAPTGCRIKQRLCRKGDTRKNQQGRPQAPRRTSRAEILLLYMKVLGSADGSEALRLRMLASDPPVRVRPKGGHTIESEVQAEHACSMRDHADGQARHFPWAQGPARRATEQATRTGWRAKACSTIGGGHYRLLRKPTLARGSSGISEGD